jgi:hypothetical protein
VEGTVIEIELGEKYGREFIFTPPRFINPELKLAWVPRVYTEK